MHNTGIRQEIIDRVLARRGKLHLFDHFPPEETALVVIDMQPTFVAPGAPAEVPAARGIVATIQRLANSLRPRGVLICWVTHANSQTERGSDWNGFFDYFVADDVREKTLASLKHQSTAESKYKRQHYLTYVLFGPIGQITREPKNKY